MSNKTMAKVSLEIRGVQIIEMIEMAQVRILIEITIV